MLTDAEQHVWTRVYGATYELATVRARSQPVDKSAAQPWRYGIGTLTDGAHELAAQEADAAVEALRKRGRP